LVHSKLLNSVPVVYTIPHSTRSGTVPLLWRLGGQLQRVSSIRRPTDLLSGASGLAEQPHPVPGNLGVLIISCIIDLSLAAWQLRSGRAGAPGRRLSAGRWRRGPRFTSLLFPDPEELDPSRLLPARRRGSGTGAGGLWHPRGEPARKLSPDQASGNRNGWPGVLPP